MLLGSATSLRPPVPQQGGIITKRVLEWGRGMLQWMMEGGTGRPEEEERCRCMRCDQHRSGLSMHKLSCSTMASVSSSSSMVIYMYGGGAIH